MDKINDSMLAAEKLNRHLETILKLQKANIFETRLGCFYVTAILSWGYGWGWAEADIEAEAELKLTWTWVWFEVKVGFGLRLRLICGWGWVKVDLK